MKKNAYRSAGVDVEKANKLIKNVKGLIDTTKVRGCKGSIGGFGGFFDLSETKITSPLLVAATDGVGTKLEIAKIAKKHDTIGIDLVAMCANDVLCSGAKPLFFLDYFATGKLNEKVWKEVIKGIVKGCRDAECALSGGETAEMPGMYPKGEYDVAGFVVGSVNRKKVISAKGIKAGDVLLGLASSGLHSNGYSLVRKIFPKTEIKRNYKLFLKPTIIYVKPFLSVARVVKIKGAAHITGGGFYDNIPRALPKNTKAVIDKNAWIRPKVYKLITDKIKISEVELFRTFNMGIGMVLVLSAADAEKAKKIFEKKFKLKSWIIGRIEKRNKGFQQVKIGGKETRGK
ncbi:MAG: phosphoribosylformylglycinamidine cyclo-ligase [Candidatus Omnitrophica bacterium]|nr:phosphoribosylformylglycinamidine cyclo-ligase [Candidatus Omnitrophota bacterium]